MSFYTNDEKKKKKKLITVHFPLNNYFDLKKKCVYLFDKKETVG